MAKTLTQSALDGFYGTEGYHRLSPLHGGMVCTDGVAFLAEAGEAFWLVDAIASHYAETRRRDSALFCTLTVRPDRSATLTGDDGNGGEYFRQEIEFTDFPLPEAKIWVMDGVALLPSEY